MDLNTYDHIIAFIVMVVFPGLSFLSSRSSDNGLEPQLPEKIHIYLSNGLMLWIGALLVLTGWNLSGKSWGLIGIQWPIWTDNVLYLVIALLVIYFGDTFYSIISKRRKMDEGSDEAILERVLPENWKEYGQYTFLAVSAGVCEEVVYRGFLINYMMYLTALTGYGPLLAVVVPSVVFAVSHLYQGWFSVVKIFALSMLFSGIFLLSKSLLLVVIIHVFVDLFSGALFVWMKKSELKKSEVHE